MARLLLLSLTLASALHAQTPTPPPFTIRTTQPNLVQTLSDGGTLAFAADGIGLASDASATLTYRPAVSTFTAAITLVDLSGSSDFSIIRFPDLTTPQTVPQNVESSAFSLRYKPSTSKAVTARLTITYGEMDTANIPAFRGTRTGTITLNLTGVAPEFGFNYVVQPNGNSTLLNQGDVISLPPTLLFDTASAVISVVNKGSGPGVINAVTLTGLANFALAGLPIPPVNVDAGKTLAFSVRFTPDRRDPLSAAVRVDLAGGRSVIFNVRGSGLGSQFTYEILTAQRARPLQANDTVVLPDAVVGGDKTLITIRVNNVGNLDDVITAISAAGASFAVAEAPFLPVAISAGGSFTLVVSFNPAQPGKSTGRLRIGDDNFNLEGTGLGSNLTFTYVAGGGSIGVQNAGTLVFTPTPVGGIATIQVTARNDGTAPTQINSISVTGTGKTFTVADLPSLPVQLAPAASITFSISFAPASLGSNTGTLRIDNLSFTVSGAANPPAALPDYTFSGATNAADAQQQLPISLALNSAYPLALSGTLTLNFTSDVFSGDPNVQFSSGGRTVAFTIAANAKQAIFPNGATEIRVQTGTVAGTIILTPSFATATGAIDLTPAAVRTITLSVPQSAPRVLSLIVSAKTTNSFTLLVTGLATGRSVTQMDFQLTPTSGENVATTRITMNVEQAFATWYQTQASQAFGSLFTATIPFTIDGDLNKVSTQVETIQSVSLTMTNRQGVSPAKSVDLK